MSRDARTWPRVARGSACCRSCYRPALRAAARRADAGRSGGLRRPISSEGSPSTLDHTDVRHATTNNFSGRAVYPEARALQREARRGVRAHRKLARTVWPAALDGYRPWSVTVHFWRLPAKARLRRRSAGLATQPRMRVDLTLFDLATGAEVATPSYDDFSEKAAWHTPAARSSRRRDLLFNAGCRFHCLRERVVALRLPRLARVSRALPPFSALPSARGSLWPAPTPPLTAL
jgi:D-alanyl-D-alanine dipeptidase